jgi:hypothetical protein
MVRNSLDRSRSVVAEPVVEFKSIDGLPFNGALNGPCLRKRRSKRCNDDPVQCTDQVARYLTASPDWKVARKVWWTKRHLRIAAHAHRIQHVLRRIESRCGHHRGRGRRRAVWCIDLRRHFCSLSAAARFVRRSPNSISRAAQRGGKCGGLEWEFCGLSRKKVNAKTRRRQGQCAEKR